MFWVMIFEILVGRNTLSIGETFGEIFRPLRKLDACHAHAQIWAENLIFLILGPKLDTMVLNRSSWSPECSYMTIFKLDDK